MTHVTPVVNYPQFFPRYATMAVYYVKFPLWAVGSSRGPIYYAKYEKDAPWEPPR
jgi:hypothetical protein